MGVDGARMGEVALREGSGGEKIKIIMLGRRQR